MVWPVWWSMWDFLLVWASCRVAPLVMGVTAGSPEASVKKMRSAGDGCGRRHGFMGR